MKSIFAALFLILKIVSAEFEIDESVLFGLGEGCGSKDISHNVNFLKWLENCKVIYGHLRIANLASEKINEFQFPELRHVTDYVVFDNVSNLVSLEKLFPSLTTILGEKTFRGSSLLIFNNPNLLTIGLKSLRQVRDGIIKIENNPSLCFVKTINWNLLTNKSEVIHSVRN